ncbi:MAG TPA: hypothetical protein VHO90_07085, partial [Bacteroidales bacterium]|nr:hypothetical protein [Bacteroidales bacterium]
MYKSYQQHIYFIGLLLLAVSLPLSIFLLSVAMFILTANWLLENNFRQKLEITRSRKSIASFIIIYIVHLLGMLYSADWTYGIHDLKIKLPLLILPLIIGTSKPLNEKKLEQILLFFCGAVLISTIISIGKLLGWWGTKVVDIRDISIFISHIRLALMINMSIFILIWIIPRTSSIAVRILFIISMLWFIFFLTILKSLTGIFILGTLVLFFGIRKVLRSQDLIAKWFILVGCALMVLMGATYITHSISKFYYKGQTDLSNLDHFTKNGNIYTHDISSKDFENGNYTWLYVCDKEMENNWNRRSSVKFNGTDLKGQELRYTLIRYLTSKGLRKDSAGVCSLDSNDIRNIELGMANYIYSQQFSFYPRIYQLLWEIHQYKNGGNPSGHSFTQRIEYLKTAKNILLDNFWTGVGTGDVAAAFKEQYIKDDSKLVERWRLRAHNQMITFFL